MSEAQDQLNQQILKSMKQMEDRITHLERSVLPFGPSQQPFQFLNSLTKQQDNSLNAAINNMQVETEKVVTQTIESISKERDLAIFAAKDLLRALVAVTGGNADAIIDAYPFLKDWEQNPQS